MLPRSKGSSLVTGSMLRDIVACPRLAWHDVHADPAMRDQVSSFVELLRRDKIAHEEAVVAAMAGRVVDLRREAYETIEHATEMALAGHADHVVGGRISSGGLVGRPDVISRIEGQWVAGDIKSGAATEANGRDAKEEYAVQVGLYARILGERGLGENRRAFVIGADGQHTWYDLDAKWCDTTLHARTKNLVEEARAILDGTADARGAASAACGLCQWRTVCEGELVARDDLTLVAGLGARLRAAIEPVAPTRRALADIDLETVSLPGGRCAIAGVGLGRLGRMQARARLQLAANSIPYALEPLGLARAGTEWHWDIEADPTSGGVVYLHGIWERTLSDDGATSERFIHFLAEGPDGEREAFDGCWRFLNTDQAARAYYYAPYERTMYRLLQARYPDVCSSEELEAFFASDRVIDLYTDIVAPRTEWPTRSYGLKALAKLNGFRWAEADASGAASIAWYQEWLRTGDDAIRDRIVDYNRSDCQASAVVLDAVIALPVHRG